MKNIFITMLLMAGWTGAMLATPDATEGSALNLLDTAQVDSEGVMLNQIAVKEDGTPLPALRIAAAPAFGQPVLLKRTQVLEAIAKHAPDWTATNWTGAEKIRITRRARVLSEEELLGMLQDKLQKEQIKQRGELELRLTRSWTPVSVPDEPIEMNILSLPSNGVVPMFIARFELKCGREVVGTWQAALQAKVMREVWVAKAPLRRGQMLVEAELAREKRDVLTLRETPADPDVQDPDLEIADAVQSGAPLLERNIKTKPVIYRGQYADAILQDGAMIISMKVELLEDGLPGQLVRARNMQTRREIKGRVINQQTLSVSL